MKTDYEVEVGNMTVCASLSRSVNLELVRGRRPVRFQARIVRRRDHPTVLLFQSGQMVCVGAKSSTAAFDAMGLLLLELRRTLRNYGDIDAGLLSFTSARISNIVFHSSLDVEVDLDKLLSCIKRCYGYTILQRSDCWSNGRYEPELYPALQVRHGASATLLIFRTGKLIITGCKTIKDASSAIKDLHSCLYNSQNCESATGPVLSRMKNMNGEKTTSGADVGVGRKSKGEENRTSAASQAIVRNHQHVSNDGSRTSTTNGKTATLPKKDGNGVSLSKGGGVSGAIRSSFPYELM